jgi:hypothetical protein
MKGKDEDIDILIIQLEFENDQSNKGMRNEPQPSIEIEIEHVLYKAMKWLELHKKFNYNSISKIISFKLKVLNNVKLYLLVRMPMQASCINIIKLNSIKFYFKSSNFFSPTSLNYSFHFFIFLIIIIICIYI